MTRLGWFECLILVAFWLGGLAAFLIGGLVWLGWVAEVFIWTVFVWAARAIYVTFIDDLMEEIERSKAFREWGKHRRVKGIE